MGRGILALVLLARWGGTVLERPNTVSELEQEETIVLTRRLQSPRCGIESDLSRAMVRMLAIRDHGVIRVLRARTYRGYCARVEIRYFPRSPRVPYVINPNSRLEIGARQRRRIVSIIDAAVVCVVGEA